MNPFTHNMYLPLVLNNTPATTDIGSLTSRTLQPASNTFQQPVSSTWAELDATFRRQLPNDWYLRRLAHRGLTMRACPVLATLDGIAVTKEERIKAEELLSSLA